MGRTDDAVRSDNLTQFHSAVVTGDKQTLNKLILTSSREIDVGDQFGRTPLMYCVLTDRLDCAEILLKAGCNINRKDLAGRNALHWGAHKGNFRLCKLLVSRGASFRGEKDADGQTALHLCTRHKTLKCMALLLKKLEPGEVDDQDNNKRTALHWSASYGNVEHIKLLIKQDSNIGIPDNEGKTPLHWAASCKEQTAVHCVKLLLETAPSVLNWQDYEGRTALHLAVADGNEEVVKLLLGFHKCNVSALDNMFRTPLHWAAVLGHTKICSLLLEKNVDLGSLDSNGATALHYAAQNNFAETVKVFLGAKSYSDVPDMEGRTALMWAAAKGADEVIKVMVDNKPDLNKADRNGGTALHAAALSGHKSSVRQLIKAGTPVNCVDLLKHTPLFRAAEMGHFDCVQTLIECRAKVDITDQDGRTPLHWAALGGHAYICQTLLRYLGPNVKDHSGRSPLQCAAYGGFVNCMSVLMEHKANPNLQDNDGMSALHWSCSKGHLDAVKLLLEYGAFPNLMEHTEDRYTPLDYALQSGRKEVAQHMTEQGALTVQGIQDIAAKKIQSSFKGFRIRRAFQEKKNLMMKHEQLKREAARKKAEEEYRRKVDTQHKREVEERRRQELSGERPRRKKGPVLTEEEEILLRSQMKRELVTNERERIQDYKRQQEAASCIQRAWKLYVFKEQGIMKTAKDAIREKRLAAGEGIWKKQIAALTIQLAWRKYYRKRLMSKFTSQRKKIVTVWDKNILSGKQRHLVEKMYSEQFPVPDWTPLAGNRPTWKARDCHLTQDKPTDPTTQHKLGRPTWLKMQPSPAALSFNFAVDQYNPAVSRQMGPRSTEIGPVESAPLKTRQRKVARLESSMANRMSGGGDVTDDMQQLQLNAQQYSYNLQKQ